MRRIYIFDTTLRDGEQSPGASLSVEEKLEIARRFLIPRQIEENGLNGHPVTFTDGALRRIIREYTYEGGVRNLEREIANVCRKAARRLAEGKRPLTRVTPA
ncbi:MAG: hypothetical protein ACK45F_10980, partial [bacterium]